MKKGNKSFIGVIVAILILFLILIGLVGLFVVKALKESNNNANMVTVTFKTEGGTKVDDMKVKKGTEITLPSTAKDGYNFDGWYIDDKKVEDKITVEKDTEVLAKWLKIPEDAKTFTITFDTRGGSTVNKITVECDKELTLPSNPKKSGYNFVTWEDKNETPILNGALLACEDLTLYAKWEEEKKESPTPTKTKTYECPSGYKLEGTNCTIEGTVHEKCPDGTKIDGNLCIKTSDNNAGTRQCKEATVIIDGKGHTETTGGDYYMVGNSYGKCAYHLWKDLTQSQCNQSLQGTSKKVVWVTELGACYAETKMGNYETICASDYQYYSSEQLSSKFGIHDNGKCLKKVDKTKYCDTDYNYTNGKCIKTIAATEK